MLYAVDLAELVKLRVGGLGDSAEATRLGDRMDLPWRELSAVECEHLVSWATDLVTRARAR